MHAHIAKWFPCNFGNPVTYDKPYDFAQLNSKEISNTIESFFNGSIWSELFYPTDLPSVRGAEDSDVVRYFFCRPGITATRGACQIAFGHVRSVADKLGISSLYFPLGGQPPFGKTKVAGSWLSQFKNKPFYKT